MTKLIRRQFSQAFIYNLIFSIIQMTVKKHGKWSKPVMKTFVNEKPDYRMRMSDNAKKIKTLPVYKEESVPAQESDHLFLMKNIFN